MCTKGFSSLCEINSRFPISSEIQCMNHILVLCFSFLQSVSYDPTPTQNLKGSLYVQSLRGY